MSRRNCLRKTDIEVKDGNNVYAVRLVNGVAQILIRIDKNDDYRRGDGLLSPYERKPIIKVALGCDGGDTGTCDQLSAGGQRHAIKVFGESSGFRTSKAGLHHKFEQCRRVAKRIIEFVLGAKTPPLLTKKKMAAGASTARLKTERDTPAIQAADGISSPPHGSLPTEEPMGEWDLVPEGKQRVWCNHCEMLSINGVPCHESDCPNVHKVWDPTALPLCQTSHPDRQYGEWVNREHFAATTDKSDNPVPGDEQGLFTPLAHDPSSCTAEVAKAGRILVVDDEEAIRAIIVSMLVSAGYECREAAGGLEALAVLESGEQFDLMLDDLMMPGLDGIGLLERSKDKYPDMPVVIVTAVQSPEASLCPLCRPRC